ncbi:MAG: LLM class flavin-dependent oxidoreductase [Thermomicrobiales bacterium]|nr:LLM class flavin-dependent oxidoreductase [Thermomicrobiales bacterium]
MPDYGHDIRFGLFLTPAAQQAENVVALSRLADQAGLDYVTFQDHPYNPAFIDAFTLMTWVAAQTESIKVFGNVLNLPLRPPAMLARSSAALDILSNGRYELGIGSGAFWDPIVAMGSPRRSPGEAVRALEEAIDLIRDIWNTQRPGDVRFQGEFYQVNGMNRGPQTPTRIPILLGAYKPKMLALLGQKGDGWLPTLGYMGPEGFAEGNARIDDAAVEAGRSPQDIRRMYNIMGSFLRSDRSWLKGTPATWAEQLAELSLRDGVSTYLLAANDPATIETWAEEVAPAVREIVAKARGEEIPERASRPSLGTIFNESGATRSDKIDYEAIPASLKASSVTPDDPGYDRVRSTYMQSGTPGLVLMAASAEQVSEGILYAGKQDVPFSVRSGSHGTLSTNSGGIILDISRINDITVLDEATRRVRIGAGATWGMVAEALAPYGLAMTSGDFPDVGVGGLITAGGIGLLARKYGLAIDNVTAADIITADGTLHSVNAEQNPELFWGIRGAGANLGVVTHIEVKALPVNNVIVAQITFDASNLVDFLVNWGGYMENAPRELESFLYYTPSQRGARSGATAQALMVWADDDVDAAVAALNPVLEVAPVLQQGATMLPYATIMQPVDQAHSGQQTLKVRSGLINDLHRETAEAIAELVEVGRLPWMNFRHLGGAVNDVSPDATAWAHRSQLLCLSAYDLYPDRRNLDPAWQRFQPFVYGCYQNLDSDYSERTTREVFPSPTYERIQRLKTQYDPTNLFRRNHNIPPVK